MISSKIDEICRENYIAGSYLRKELRGHYDYFRFTYDNLMVDAAKGNFIILDKLADQLLAKGVINQAIHNLYQENLKNYFSDFHALEEMSDEEIYGEIGQIRKESFDEKVFQFLERSRQKDLWKYYRRSLRVFPSPEIFQELIYFNVEPARRFLTSPIDRLNKLQKEIRISAKDIIIIPDNYGQLPFLLKLLTDYIYPHLERDLLAGKQKVYLLLKKEAVAGEPTYKDWLYLIEKIKLQKLQYLLDNEIFKVMLYNNKCAGLDLGKLSKPLHELFRKAFQGKGMVIGIGEKMLFSLHGAGFSYYLLVAVKSIRAQRYTNLYHKSNERIPYLIGYVPPGQLPAAKFSGVEPIYQTFYHFNLLLDENGEKIGGLQGVPPELDMNFYATTYHPEQFPEFKLRANKLNFYQYNRQKQAFFKEIVEQDGLAQYLAIYYNLKELSRVDSAREFKKCQEGLIFNGILIDDLSKVTLFPYIAREYKKGIVSPRELVEEKKVPPGSFLYFNFLYFVTDRIIYTYNQLRRHRKKEQLDLKNIYLGYKLEYTDKKNRDENFPLYNKGFVAYTKSGEILFGNRTLAGGKILINDLPLSWQENQVNTTNKEQEFIIYTPLLDNELLSEKKIDYLNFKYEVGQSRLNLVLIDNRIVTVRKDGVLLPSIGVVLSFTGSLAKEVSKVLNLREIGDGYYLPGKYKISVYLDKPADIASEKWQEVSWAYGGGTILVRNGQNLVVNRETQVRSFAQEGWFHPLSKQTQETQVQDWARGPRTVIGSTEKKQFFAAVFSGRTAFSQGVNFSEVVYILEKEMGPLDWVLNLDGGASSCLGLIYKNQFFELSYPAVSRITSAGMVRPVNSMVYLTKNT
jgi:hypothetical protein